MAKTKQVTDKRFTITRVDKDALLVATDNGKFVVDIANDVEYTSELHLEIMQVIEKLDK